jgi:glyceraldehyde-3-phosphate dehydrogenase/erythrose-4-phosphate dehydrogenase
MIVHEYPFNMVEHEVFVEWVKSMRPHFPLKSRVTVRKDIMDYSEKDKLYAYFKTIRSRFSATMDMWTSNQNKGYMCVTLHWIDDEWKIQKRIINFFHVQG